MEPRPLANVLLGQLPAAELERLRGHLSRVEIVEGQVLYEARAAIEHAYFLESGMVSVITSDAEGSPGIEVGMIGREGVVGLSAMFDAAAVSFYRTIVQLPGWALRIGAADMLQAGAELTTLRFLCFRYLHASMVQTAQNAACNLMHTVQQRVAKWILMAHDCVEGSEIPIKHQFLANMLGVRRPSTTLALAGLQEAGVIETHRGRLIVLDRTRLEASGCACYRLITDELRRAIRCDWPPHAP